jgi:hypothetical protein
MHWHIIKALLVKEGQRHLANKGGITLAMLLIAAAVLLTVFAPAEAADGNAGGTTMVGGVRHCFIDFDRNTEFIKHLRDNVPPELSNQIRFRPLPEASKIDTVIVYPTGTGALQVRQFTPNQTPTGRYTVHVSVWHPAGNPLALAPYEAWFWKEHRRWEAARARGAEGQRDGITNVPQDPEFDAQNIWLVKESHQRFQEQLSAANPGAKYAMRDLEVIRKGLGGRVLDIRSAIATGLVVFALYFSCVYMLPTLNCEERERGVLLAQALSPASPLEIVAAKFLFYPVAGILLAGTIGIIHRPAVAASPFFWASLIAVSAGFLGIGMTIATLARTQRAAFLGGMCYLLSVSMFLMICSLNNIPFLPWLTVEYHGPRALHAAVTGEILWYNWWNLAGSFGLGIAWLTIAVVLFRKRGWQ